ncbi:ATP-binding protein [Frankia sp. AgB1.9]|uniref:ATP-binding protein n=1 Tax=unclassified Frankia TaxID=2632575 RepID=UPI001932284B|nr:MULTISPECIES: ATP-binding protein [unclassified Frankia]MBL7486945.1 ATP-binding protein [Frankia sp. AgW1.1]MBL7551856.1 ATP-binding protein [Frankia sp. AgB1.9]MBL7625363.1 ATP-binding protein [Frankia sp. AgB1.8]
MTDRDTSPQGAVFEGEPPGGGGRPDDEVLVQLRVDASPDAVPRARRVLGAGLANGSPPVRDLVGDVKLLAGELLTNAVLHGAPPVDLRVVARPDCLRLEVADTSPVAPLQARGAADLMTGRGLALVAGLAARWGTLLNGHGKVVWAELDLADQPVPLTLAPQPTAPQPTAPEATAPPLGAPTPARPAAGPVTPLSPVAAEPWSPRQAEPTAEPRYRVCLGDVSTELLLAAKSHVDNIVREFALAASGATSGESSAVPPRLAELISQVTTGFAEARRIIRQQAIEAAAAGQRSTRLELSLPASAADAGERYLAALDQADEYARQARLLTLEAPPQHWAFRRWYVSSLVDQLRAAADGRPLPEPPSFEEFLRQGDSSRALSRPTLDAETA